MLNLTYIGEKTVHKVEFDLVSKTIVSVKGSLSAKTKGFTLSREGEEDNWDYSAYNTVYREKDGKIYFSNDGSQYTPEISFGIQTGGILTGEVRQAVKQYGELVIPTAEAEENYEFTGWSPEIPTEGAIEENKTFMAQMQYIPTLQERQEAKVAEMNTIQQNIIGNGVEVQLSTGKKERFTLTVNDQLSLLGLSTSVDAGLPQIHWHEANEEKHCEYYSPEDMLSINTAAMSFVAYHVTYFRSLRIYIRSLQTKDEIEAVTYGMAIPEEYQGQVLKDMLAQMVQGVAG